MPLYLALRVLLREEDASIPRLARTAERRRCLYTSPCAYYCDRVAVGLKRLDPLVVQDVPHVELSAEREPADASARPEQRPPTEDSTTTADCKV